MNDPEMSPLRQQMEVDLRNANAERDVREGMAREAAEAAKKNPEPVGGGTLPAAAAASVGGGEGNVGERSRPAFPTLDTHLIKHDGLTREIYYGNTLRNIRDCWTGKGLKVNFRHDGVDKLAHIKRTGDNSFTLTVTTHDLKRIYTHFEGADKQYLLNKGITLPKGF